ncbi:MAG TPA: hypothetical protein VLC09_21230 [Polyangiaceae bacterium]|nr:hypothetical protein [Polyangiaceae bacterium]
MRTLLASFLLAGLVSFSAANAQAQSGDTASARSFAEQGVTAYEKGDYAKASDLLLRAETLRHAPPHLLWLARSYAKQGMFVEAREQYLALQYEKLDPKAPAVFVAAQETAASEVEAIEPRISYLTIHVRGVSDSTATVQANGKPVDKIFLDAERPANPGHYELVAQGDSTQAPPQKFELAEGQHLVVTVELQSKAGTAAAAAPEADAAGQEKPSAVPVVVSLGVGIVGVTLGTVFLVNYLDTRAEADRQFADCTTNCSSTEQDSIDALDASANTNLAVSIASYGVGVAGLTVATILWLNGSSSGETAAPSAPGVRFMARGNEIGLAGTF